jgi:hypothetical protein
MGMKILMICLVFGLLFSQSLFAQMPMGPHKGHVKSAGPFNVEIVVNKDGSFNAYLLDAELKNPKIRYSYVTGFTEASGQAKQEILCVAKTDYFDCFPRGANLKKAKKLYLNLARSDVKGDEVTFDLPLFDPQELKSAPARIQALNLSKNHKFMSFRNGKRKFEDISELENGEVYCALENIKMLDLKIKTKKKALLNIEKIEFPNLNKKRYSVIDTKDYSVYCDFTADKTFTEAKLIDKINQQMAGFLKISR